MMDVIEKFLNPAEYKVFESLVQGCTEREAGEAHYNDDNAIQGFDNSAYILTTSEFQNWWLGILKQKGHIKQDVTPTDIASLYIVESRPPYHANWHRDSMGDIHLGSVILYFGDDFNIHDGGLFLAKSNQEDVQGTWVLPSDNVAIINPNDVFHVVTKFENKDIVRKMVIMFLRQKDFT